jgi:histidine triad (HIT) family protein
MDCIFCKIAAGEIPSNKVYEDDLILAFHDIAPAAPVHVLFIPKAHIVGVREITPDNAAVVAHIFSVIPQVAKALGVTDYRVVSNNGADAGQTVHHLHFHLLGGATLGGMV